jgi:hypothetical protein
LYHRSFIINEAIENVIPAAAKRRAGIHIHLFSHDSRWSYFTRDEGQKFQKKGMLRVDAEISSHFGAQILDGFASI